jgi:hypothetical protein
MVITQYCIHISGAVLLFKKNSIFLGIYEYSIFEALSPSNLSEYFFKQEMNPWYFKKFVMSTIHVPRHFNLIL